MIILLFISLFQTYDNKFNHIDLNLVHIYNNYFSNYSIGSALKDFRMQYSSVSSS